MFAWVKSNWTVKKTWAAEPTFNFWCTEPYPKALVAFCPAPWGLKSLLAYMQRSWNIPEEQKLSFCMSLSCFVKSETEGSLALPFTQATWKRIATRTKKVIGTVVTASEKYRWWWRKAFNVSIARQTNVNYSLLCISEWEICYSGGQSSSDQQICWEVVLTYKVLCNLQVLTP